MIQRIQTVYMAIAVIIAIVCICFPVGAFVPDGMGGTAVMSNLCIISGETEHQFDFSVVGLLIILVSAILNTVFTIFMYVNRKRQAKLCILSILLLVAWYIYYGACSLMLTDDYNASFSIRFNAALPLVSLILIWMARKAILADEALVKAADRIR